MNSDFVKFVSSYKSSASSAALAIYEQVCSDVNKRNVVPDPRCCTDEVDENEYFPEQTVSDEVLAQCHAAKRGARAAVYPSAGRTSNHIMGNGFPENVCASSGTSST